MQHAKRERIKRRYLAENWEKRFQKGITLVDFDTPWCAPCRVQRSIVDQLAGRYQGKARIVELDVDAHRKTAMQLGITSIPTVILFKDGVEMQRFVGIQPVEVLSMAIEMVLVKHKK
ncbi:MAG: thiol reductase thioredoxin [Deltaproteobacteria bacterium]|nr:MAG: thiol reductase thioredoxin [Deltaproteobacteria bacterium]